MNLSPREGRILRKVIFWAVAFVWFSVLGFHLARATEQDFNYTGSVASWTVPTGVTSITLNALGAQGGWSQASVNAGAEGGEATGNLSVSPGSTYYYFVGGVGGAASAQPGGTGGLGSGGDGGSSVTSSWGGGGGGGMTWFSSQDSFSTGTVVLVGGGGAGANTGGASEGYGGGLSGSNGDPSDDGFATPGHGGTQTAGGSAGSPGASAASGTFGSAGQGGFGGYGNTGGGGGGGGYYGGGGGGGGQIGGGNGTGGDGGGGSSFMSSSLTSTSTTSGVNLGDGELTISYDGPVENYYAQVTSGAHHIFSSESDSSAILKALPADWVIHVLSSTDSSGDPMVSGGFHWFQVADPTDGVTGWMAASDTSGQYISSYDGSMQEGFIADASTTLDDKPTRAAAIVQAVNGYYAAVGSTSDSLYNPDLSAIFSTTTPSSTFPEDIVFAIAAHEDGGGFDFNNEQVAPDYGSGIMQITTLPTSSDIYYLQVLLNKDPDTQIATGTAPGAPGYETHSFGSATEAAVKNFQTKYGISPASGAVGYYTLDKLNALLPTSSIPSAFVFHEAMSTSSPFDSDRLSPGPENLGIASGLSIPPCGELNHIGSSTYIKNCYEVPSSTYGEKIYAPQPYYGNQVFKFYANTTQSIYANIKDGLAVLNNVYIPLCATNSSATTTDGVTFQCYEREWILDAWNYNGDGSGYLDAIADKLNSFSDYISPTGTQMVATSSFTADLANKFEVADDNSDQLLAFSPVDIAMTDSAGRTTGVVNGQVEEGIPDSAYNSTHKALLVLFPGNGTSTYQVTGTASGTYGLEIIHNRNGVKQVVYAPAIPASPGVIHTYTIDWTALSEGKKGVTIKVHDPENAKMDKVVSADALLSDFAVATSTRIPTSTLSFAPPVPSSVKPPVIKLLPVRPQIISVPAIPSSTFSPGVVTSTFSESSTTQLVTSTLEMDTSTLELYTSTIETTTSTENNSSTQN